MSSTRLPGKVLRTIVGRPMLSLQLERLRRAKRPDRLVVATSSDVADDRIAALCAEEGVDCFRGSLLDVLDRYYRAAAKYRPDHVVRLTADCPLADPRLIDELIDFYLAGGYDFASNAVVRTFPRGLDAAVFRFSLLARAWREAMAREDREHVTPYMKRAPGVSIGSHVGERDRSDMRWTVDEPADFAFVSAVYERLYAGKPDFDTEDVLALLRSEPNLLALNRDVRQKAHDAR